MNTASRATILPEKMVGGRGDPIPIEIGARGTVGNLVMKEIEYFKRLHGDNIHHVKCSANNSLKPDKKHGGDASNFWPNFGFLTIKWRKGGSRFLPRMCMAVDVADSRHHNHHRLSKIPGFGYQNLKDDIEI